MPLKNSQYNTIMRMYSERKLRHARELDEHREKVLNALPEYGAVQEELAANAAARARAKIGGNEALYETLVKAAEDLKEKKAAILSAHRVPEGYLELQYDCPDCRDTGFIGNEKCHCFTQAAIELLYDQSNIREILEKENFDRLTMDYYNAEAPQGKKSQYDYMAEKIAICHDYVNFFDQGPDNLLFYGPTGTGKTFLSNCIAKALMDSCHSVVYFSAPDLFDLFSKTSFSYDEEAQDQADQYVLESDLLIIDDLGTERVNSFTTSKLFYTVNERLNRGKSTIISTNLSPTALRDEYTERTASRILSNYEVIQLAGEDIRIKKKYGV